MEPRLQGRHVPGLRMCLSVLATLLIILTDCAQSQIEPGLANMTVLEGSDVLLKCNARPNNPSAVIRYTWQFQGNTILPSWLRSCDSSQQNGNKCIYSVTASQSGYFTCTATDIGNGVVLGTLKGYVNILRPIKFAVQPRSITVATNTRAQLSCRVDPTAGSAAQINWYRQTLNPSPAQVAVSSRVKIDYAAGTLTFDYVEVSDVDLYICNASNAAGSTSVAAYVRLEGTAKPTLAPNKNPATLTVAEKSSFLLHCEVLRASPSATVHWYKGSLQLSSIPFRRSLFSNNSVKISNVEQIDVGTYYCQAKNTLGTTDSTATVVTVGDTVPTNPSGGNGSNNDDTKLIGISIGAALGGLLFWILVAAIIVSVIRKRRLAQQGTQQEWMAAQSIHREGSQNHHNPLGHQGSLFTQGRQKDSLQRRMDSSFYGRGRLSRQGPEDDVAALTKALEK